MYCRNTVFFFISSDSPFDNTNSLMNYPNIILFLYSDCSPSQCPCGLQPNGQILYSCAWHSGSPDTPAISATFEGTVGYHVHITQPAGGDTFCSTDTIRMILETEGGSEPFTHEWVSSIDGIIGNDDTIDFVLSVGEHTIQVNSFDSEDRYDFDTVTITIIDCETFSVSIDSVWFWEETDCNDRNIVQICYIFSSDSPDSEYTVSVQMSGDSGETWTIPLDSLWAHEGDIGDGVLPDTHCFFWEMGYDLPDSEGIFEVMVSIFGTELICEFADTIDMFPHIERITDGYPSGLVIVEDTLVFTEFSYESGHKAKNYIPY